MSTVKSVTIVAFLLGTCLLAYGNRKRLLKFLETKQGEKRMRGECNAGDAMAEVCRSFLMYADNFQGLFEPMYKASIGSISLERMRNVLMEWNIRMGNIGQAPISLKSWWATIIADFDNLLAPELQGLAESVVKMIFASGIVRDNKKDFVAEKDTNMFYQHPNGLIWNIGQKLRVESPCWFLSSIPVRIIEKGYCEII